jgi:hypothetical protein
MSCLCNGTNPSFPEVQLGLSRLVSDARGRVLAHDQRRKVTSLQPRHDNQRPDAPVPTR